MTTLRRLLRRLAALVVGTRPPPGDPDLSAVRREQAEIRARLAALEILSDWRGDGRVRQREG
jgi:hypothetical protein